MIGMLDNVIPPASRALVAARADAHVETVTASHLSTISHPGPAEQLIVEAADQAS
jgi:hypothetical protein